MVAFVHASDLQSRKWLIPKWICYTFKLPQILLMLHGYPTPPHPTAEVKKMSFYKLLIINETRLISIIGLISPDSVCNLHILHILLWKIRHFSKAVSTGSLTEQPNVSLLSLKIMFSWKISFKYIWKKSNIDHYFAIFKFLDIFNPTVVKFIVK